MALLPTTHPVRAPRAVAPAVTGIAAVSTVGDRLRDAWADYRAGLAADDRRPALTWSWLLLGVAAGLTVAVALGALAPTLSSTTVTATGLAALLVTTLVGWGHGIRRDLRRS